MLKKTFLAAVTNPALLAIYESHYTSIEDAVFLINLFLIFEILCDFGSNSVHGKT